MRKISQKSVFRCRPPKTDFRFLIYTPKNMYFNNKTTRFFNAYKIKNSITCIRDRYIIGLKTFHSPIPPHQLEVYMCVSNALKYLSN